MSYFKIINYFYENILISRLYYIENRFNLKLIGNIKNEINLGIVALGLKNGGRARITSLLINYLSNYKLFHIYLFSKKSKEKDEYKIPQNTKRILIFKINFLFNDKLIYK